MKNYILVHFITCLVPTLVMVYLYHFVIRGQSGLAFIYLSLIAVFFLSILSGILGTRYSHSMWVPAIINCGVVLIAMILSGQWGVITLVPPVFIVTFLCSLFTWLIMNGSSGSFLQRTYVIFFALLLLGGTYTFFAFINGPVHRGDSSLFFHTEETIADCEQVLPSREQHEAYLEYARSSGAGKKIEHTFSSIYSSTLLVDSDGIPYSGKLYLYSPKLKINPLPRKKEVLLYYIDGFLWGYSYGQTHLPTWYTDRALLHLPGMPASLPYLIDKKYEKQALATLSLVGEYYVMSDHRLLALGQDNRLYLGDVEYHYNGLLNYIFWKTMDLNEGLEWYHFENRYFDTLGYSDERSDWNADDFIPVDTLPELIQPGAIKDPEKRKFMEENFVRPTRIWMPENTYNWNDKESLFANLCGFHGFDKEKEYPIDILLADARDRSTHEMGPEESKQMGNILNQCLIEPQLDTPRKKHIWYDDSPVFFVIQENGTEKRFALGYKDGRFIMRNNFYSFIFPEDKEEELTEQMLRCIRKYIEPEGG